MMLFHGDGIPVDKEKAAKYLKTGAQKGYLNCMLAYEDVLEHDDKIKENDISTRNPLNKQQQL